MSWADCATSENTDNTSELTWLCSDQNALELRHRTAILLTQFQRVNHERKAVRQRQSDVHVVAVCASTSRRKALVGRGCIHSVLQGANTWWERLPTRCGRGCIPWQATTGSRPPWPIQLCLGGRRLQDDLSPPPQHHPLLHRPAWRPHVGGKQEAGQTDRSRRS